MERDQVYGWLILLLSIAVIVVYIWAVFIWNPLLILQLTGTAAIVFGFAIMAWIGYTLATTPPPEPIEIPETPPEPEKPPEEKQEQPK
jgi:predicted DNA-binding transcriptional regulator